MTSRTLRATLLPAAAAAQLTRFGDREFYKDWWNAATIGEYWKTWNMPVHKVRLLSGGFGTNNKVCMLPVFLHPPWNA